MLPSLESFDSRVERSRSQVFSSLDGRLVEHPILPRWSRICSGRRARRFEAPCGQPPDRILTPREVCLFCAGKHPSVLATIDDTLGVVIPGEEGSFAATASWMEGRDRTSIETFYGLVGSLDGHNSSREQDLVRVFLNLCPATIGSDEACFVSAVNPRFHDEDMSTAPPKVVAAIVRSWQVIEAWAISKGLTPVPFMNSGRRPASGQSIACPHAQCYVLQKPPALFREIRGHRERRWREICPICTGALSDELCVWTDPSDSVSVYADPAPVQNWTLLVVPRKHSGALAGLDPAPIGAAIQTAVLAWRGIFGVEPAFNLLVRGGEDVGHVFGELVPRSETNVLAGFELDTQQHVISIPPEVAAKECRSALSKQGMVSRGCLQPVKVEARC